MRTLFIILLAMGFSAMAQDQTEAPVNPEKTQAQKQAICKYSGMQGCARSANMCMSAAQGAESFIDCWDGHLACLQTIQNTCEEENPLEVSDE